METLTNERFQSNPCTKWITWKGGDGQFVYWDKDKSENVEAPTPLTFYVLLEYSTIKGYYNAKETSIFANEVEDTQIDLLNVRYFGKDGKQGGTIANGIYSEIKDEVKSVGGKYAKSLYVYLPETNELANIMLYGSALGPWIESKISGRAVVAGKNPTQQKNGATKYFIPTFEAGKASADDLSKATPFYQEIKKYMDEKLKKDQQEAKEEKEVTVTPGEGRETDWGVVEKGDTSELPF